MLMRFRRNRIDGIHFPVPLPAGFAHFFISSSHPVHFLYASIPVGFQRGFVRNNIRVLVCEIRPAFKRSPELRHLCRARVDALSGILLLSVNLMRIYVLGDRVVCREQCQQPCQVRRFLSVGFDLLIPLLRQFKKGFLVVSGEVLI